MFFSGGSNICCKNLSLNCGHWALAWKLGTDEAWPAKQMKHPPHISKLTSVPIWLLYYYDKYTAREHLRLSQTIHICNVFTTFFNYFCFKLMASMALNLAHRPLCSYASRRVTRAAASVALPSLPRPRLSGAAVPSRSSWRVLPWCLATLALAKSKDAKACPSWRRTSTSTKCEVTQYWRRRFWTNADCGFGPWFRFMVR